MLISHLFKGCRSCLNLFFRPFAKTPFKSCLLAHFAEKAKAEFRIHALFMLNKRNQMAYTGPRYEFSQKCNFGNSVYSCFETVK